MGRQRVSSGRPLRFGEVETGDGLAGYARLFASRPGPRLMAAALAATAAARVAMGDLRRRDLVVAASMVAAQPFTEWVIHVTILHSRPKRVLGRTVDLYAARKHREHHLDPRDIDLLLVPLRVTVGLIGGAGALVVGLGRDGRGVTAALTGFSLLLGYEWSHFLIHSPYRAKSAYFRHISRSHRLHHFKNEHYWFGVTSDLADRVIGTAPAREAVATSATARTLAA